MIVGKWRETQNDDGTVFEFGQTVKQGDKYVGQLTIFADNEPVGKYPYTILSDNSVELKENGTSYKVECEISPDGKTMQFTAPNGLGGNLTRIN